MKAMRSFIILWRLVSEFSQKGLHGRKVLRFMTPQVLDRNEQANGNGIYQCYQFPEKQIYKLKKI